MPKICISNDCGRCARYGYDVNIYCSAHKKDDMINLKDRRCCFEGCTKLATCSYKNEPKTMCGSHKLYNMIDRSSTLCHKCDIRATYGFEKGNYTSCKLHRDPGMVDTRHHRCITCDFFTVPTKNIECGCCKGTIRREILFKDFLSENFSFIHNKRVSHLPDFKERPDFVININNRILIIEYDEFQHKHYDKNCELFRMKNIYNALNEPKLTFIRFNPDSYTKCNKQIDTPLVERYQKLLNLISTIIKTDNDKDVYLECFYMFYDDKELFYTLID